MPVTPEGRRAASQYTAFTIALPHGVKGFVAAIIGGFGHARWALAGGLVLVLLLFGSPVEE